MTFNELERAFLTRLGTEGFAGTAALVVTTLEGAPLLGVQPERVFPSASTIKVPLLVCALAAVQAGALRLDERVPLRAEDRVGGSGVLHELQPGVAFSWLDLLTLMTVVSDNTATNVVIDRLGADDFNVWLSTRGLHDTRLIGRLQLPPERQNAAQRRGERNRTSARDQVRLLLDLWAGRVLNAELTALALDILGRQQLRDLIGRGVPCGPDGAPLYRVLSKSGELAGVHHDVGVLLTPRPLVVALLSEGGSDPREHPENRDVGLLSRALWSVLSVLGDIPPVPEGVDSV